MSYAEDDTLSVMLASQIDAYTAGQMELGDSMKANILLMVRAQEARVRAVLERNKTESDFSSEGPSVSSTLEKARSIEAKVAHAPREDVQEAQERNAPRNDVPRMVKRLRMDDCPSSDVCSMCHQTFINRWKMGSKKTGILCGKCHMVKYRSVNMVKLKTCEDCGGRESRKRNRFCKWPCFLNNETDVQFVCFTCDTRRRKSLEKHTVS